MPTKESDPKRRLDAHLERWATDHLQGKVRVVIKFGKQNGPVPLNEFASTRLTFQFAVNDLTTTLLAGLMETLEYEAIELSRLEMRRGDAHREFKARAERVSKRYVDSFKGAVRKLRTATDGLWDEYENPYSEDEIDAFTKTFDSQAHELWRESLSALVMAATRATNTLERSPRVSDQIHARRKLIKKYVTDYDLKMAALAWRAGTSVTAIQGMVRGDRTRYSEEKLMRFLKTIGVPPQNW